jgi:diguanylate cyclase (GGDEF)-like protein
MFGALLAITAGLLAWHHYGMERVLELTGSSVAPVTANDDREMRGGSIARLERVGSSLRMHCKLVRQYEWPYCRIRFELGSEFKGTDLSGYDRVSIDLSHTGPGPDVARITLINFEPGLSKLGDWTTYKINEIESFPVPRGGGLVEIPLNVFYTPGWWKVQNNVPLAKSGVNIRNVIRVDVLTSPLMPPGEHQLTVHTLRLHGKWISLNQLLTGLMALWIVAAICWPVMAFLVLRGELKSSKAQLVLLSEVNKALELEAKELAGQAHIDALTGVLNRQGLRAALINTSNILADPMSIIFMDIDHFKHINDTHGHDRGDVVLRQFAKAIGSNIRTSDRLVRWGGEEFLIVCPNTDVHQAAALADKLRQSLYQETWPAGLRVTASFGVAQHRSSEEIGEVIKRADQELYSAKSAGRDRVHAHGLPRPVITSLHMLRA